MTTTDTDTIGRLVGRLMDYEAGELSDGDTVDLFVDLINTGMAWNLQGHYERGARALFDAGLITVDPETGVATSHHQED